MNDEKVLGIIGTALAGAGTIAQVDDVLKIISMIITIIGGIITWIVIPIINWYNKAKADGKITSDEIHEGIEIIDDGVHHIEDNLKNKEGENGPKN